MSEADRDFLALQRALIGRYSLVRELGRGGMGVVFLARDVALDRPVAIKLLPAALGADPQRRAQFLGEARLAAGLAHPNIVPIHVVEASGTLAWFAMAFVDGESLGARVRRLGPLPPSEVVPVIRQVAMALAHAHARGIVHGDVKPDNILLERDSGRALVTDFGIAHRGDAAAGLAGTPQYLSPEQADGSTGTARSDLYALGVTAWFALTGRHPHDAPTVAGLLVAKSTADAPTIGSARPHLPSRLVSAIDRSLARDPSARWPDAEHLARELDQVEGPPATPPAVKAFVRSAITLGDDAALSAGIALSSLGITQYLIVDGNLISAYAGLAILIPTAAVAASFGVIRSAQAAVAAVDVVRRGHGHDDVALAVSREVREREVEEDTPGTRATRRREALSYGALGALKSALAVWVVTSDLPAFLWIPASIVAAVVPALTVLKVHRLLRPGFGRWPRWLQGRTGRALFSLIRRFTRRPASYQMAGTPTVAALRGEVVELYEALPHGARRTMADLPRLAEGLQLEAAALRARPRSETTDARLATIATALETLRIELLSLHAGLRTVPDVTMALDRARAVSTRVDQAIGSLPEITPA